MLILLLLNSILKFLNSKFLIFQTAQFLNLVLTSLVEVLSLNNYCKNGSVEFDAIFGTAVQTVVPKLELWHYTYSFGTYFKVTFGFTLN